MIKKIPQELEHILAASYADASIIQFNIASKLNEATLADIPESIVPSSKLLALASGFIALHNKLVEANLLQPLNHKQTLH